MTQSELAQHAKLPQSHIAAIEKGKLDPRLSTLRKIFEALSCEMVLEPRPAGPLQEVLHQRARHVALRRLTENPGMIDLEGREPNESLFLQIVEKLTKDILYNPKERVWRDAKHHQTVPLPTPKNTTD
ncbi:MAG: hypothetical protein A2901_00835 [Elusimicrobia bacterium RIFCSPLOWO2_01_FULL_54_10]|nr:MAG: hypothetical protein A2901_00835 [Elusimicrobia bacterium RIFCSPLOWO2_01_FULL_54_10]